MAWIPGDIFLLTFFLMMIEYIPIVITLVCGVFCPCIWLGTLASVIAFPVTVLGGYALTGCAALADLSAAPAGEIAGVPCLPDLLSLLSGCV
jgi:hypothetical protein